MLNDLAALVPPLLVCIAFLAAVGAFLRYEMRHAGSPPQEEEGESEGSRNPVAPGANQNATGDESAGPPCGKG